MDTSDGTAVLAAIAGRAEVILGRGSEKKLAIFSSGRRSGPGWGSAAARSR
jgi:hypothetical protein